MQYILPTSIIHGCMILYLHCMCLFIACYVVETHYIMCCMDVWQSRNLISTTLNPSLLKSSFQSTCRIQAALINHSMTYGRYRILF